MHQHAALNRCFRVVWNDTTGTFVAVAENARGRGKASGGSRARLLLAATAGLGLMAGAALAQAPPAATALPVGAQVKAGNVSLQQGGSTLTVQQASQRAVIDWQRFDIGADATVRFVQPDAHSVALNRVLANDPTQINGRLQANGQVFVLNNAGVVFGQGARVDVGGLVASSLGLSDSDFLAGNLRFSSNGAAGAVRNAGQLRAAPGGYVALLGPQVSNAGSISAAQGRVALAAGQQVSLALEGSGLVAVRVDQGALQAQIDNAGQIRADDGSVLLTARAADSLTRAAINHGGLIEANSLTARGGRIVLEADAITLAAGSSTQAVGATGGGQVLVGGDWQGSGPLRQASSVALEAGASIDVSASVRGDGGRAVLWSDLGNAQGNTLAQGQISARPAGGGQGGSVETSGHQVRVDGRVDAGRGGQWLLDPSDINVATLGGTVTPLAIQTSLNAGTNVTLDSSSGSGGNGDITVTNNIASTGTSAGALTLLASRDINIKANITLTGTGKALVLNAQRNLLFDNASTDPTLTTNGGNVVVAARSAGAATGNILVNTSTSLAIATAGGQVTLGGGDAAGSGYAIGSATDNALRMGVGAKENLSINSGGGNIAIRGQAGSFNAAGTGVDSYGVGVTGTSAINSGAGTINIDGKSANSGAGDNNMAVLFNGAANITSANTSANAIRIVGDATGAAGGDLGWGVVFFNTANSVTATAAGGSILIQGTRGVGVGADNTNDVYIAGAQLLGVSGNIDVLGTTVGGQLAFGQGRMIFGATTLSPSTITSSTSNVRLRFDKFNFLSIVPDVNTMGTFTWEPVGNGFAQALRVDQLDYNQYDTTTSRRLAGYTMGKDTGATTYGSNTVSADYALTVNGPISIYGGPVTVSRNLTSATGGQILIRSSSLALGTSKLSSAGELKIETDALATPIGIAGAAGSFQVPASYFSTNFVDGFSQITIGRADGTGKITSAAVAPLDHLRLLNSSGGIELTGLVNLGANRLTLAGGGATTDTGSGQITAASLLLQGGGNVTLDNTSNSVATLAGSTGSLTYYNAGAMTIGSVNGVGGISASGVVDVATQSGDLTLSQAATTTNATASAMALNAGRSAAAGSAAGGNVVVSGGSVAVGSGGTAKLYTGSVASSTGLTALVGSGSGRFRYNSDEVSTNYSTALATGVAAIYRERPSASVTLNNASSIYGDALPTLTSTNAGLVNGDLPSLAAGGQLFSTAGKLRAGTYATTATGLAELGYNVTTVAGSLQVNRKVISASGAGVNNKVYDNTTAATINSAGSLSGAIAGDLLAATYSSASFADKNVGNAKTVTLTGGSLSGTDAANYSLASSTATATANITPKALTASGFSASNKVYDGNTTATVNSATASLTGVLGSDVVTVSASSTGTFNTKNVGNAKPVSVSGISLGGGGASNYSLASTTATTTADITPKALTVSGLAADNKVYDGNTNAVVRTSGATVSGLVGSESVSISANSTGVFDTKNVGTGKAVAISGVAIGGTDAANYSVASTGTAQADITVKLLTVSGITAANKVYDGNTDAQVSTGAASLAGVVSGESISVSASALGSFNSKHVGNAKAVAVTGVALGGSGAGNYSIASTTSTTADITPKALSVSGITAANKVYDGNTSASVNSAGLALAGLVSGDNVAVSVNSSGSFDTKNVGTGKTVTLASSYSGADVGNYSITGQASTLADITPKVLTVSGLAADNKVYDGNTDAVVRTSGATVSGLVGSESVSLSANAAGSFDTKNVGTAKAVAVSGVTISGADAGNYSVASTGTARADISTKLLTVAGITADNKVYDAGTSAVVHTDAATLSGLVGSEVVTVSADGTGSFDTKNVGTGKTVTISGVALGGGSVASNYSIASTTTTTADISRATLGLNVPGASRVYDGSTSISPGGPSSLVGVLAADVVSLDTGNVTGFVDRNAGTNKLVTYTGFALLGGDAGNYLLPAQATSNANITARSLLVNFAGQHKVYDGTVAATVTTSDNRVAGDALNISQSAAFADKHVGTAKPVSVSGVSLSGADAGNYSVAATGSTTANITPKALTINGLSAADKVYDGSTSATLNTSSVVLGGLVSGDDVVVSGATGSFDTKDAGSNKQVSLGGGSTGKGLGGTDLGNYSISAAATTTASITPKALTVAGITAANKVYDGNTDAQVSTSTATLVGLVSGESISVSANTLGSFDSRNAGTGKSVAVSGVALGGSGSANYTLASTTTTSADITPKAITVAGITAANKVYDGNTAASVDSSAASLPGLISGDAVSVSASGSFADKNVATAKTVTLTSSYSGAQAGNYSFTDQPSTTADITPAQLRVIANADAKFVIEADTATFNGVSYTGFVGGDTPAVLGGSVSIGRSNAATNIAGQYSAVLVPNVSALTASNYSFATVNGNFTIVPANELLVRMANLTNPYASTTAYTVTSAQYLLGSTIFTLPGVSTTGPNAFSVNDGAGGSAAFTIAPLAPALSGAGLLRVGNYSLGISGLVTENSANFSSTVNVVGSHTVTTKTLSPSASAGITKVYDRTTDMSGLALALGGIESGDAASVSGVGSFATKDAGTNRSYTVNNLALAGADASNYSLAASSFTGNNGTITPKDITASGFTASNKVYDGSTSATVSSTSASLAGVIAGDSVSVSASAAGSFDTKDVGTAKAVAVSGVTLGNTDAANYRVASTHTTSADISPKLLTVAGITAANKVYDANTDAQVSTSAASLAGVVSGESITVSANALGSFDNKNAGTGKTVAVSGVALGGTGAGNYSIASTTTTAADISRASLGLNVPGASRVYDGSTAILPSGPSSLVGVLAADVVTLDTGNVTGFVDRNVGSNKLVTYTGFALLGGDAGNYVLPTQATSNADITARTLLLSFTGQHKVYDGNTSTTVTSSDNRVAGDALSISQSAAFADKHVGTGKAVNVTGVSLSGADAGNYSVATTGSTTANISPKALAISGLSAADKVYDGNTAAAVSTSAASLSGLVAGDQVTLSATGTFDTKDVGNAKTVLLSINHGGTDVGNYSISDQASTTASISPKLLTVSGITAANKVYDGNADAQVNTGSATLAGVVSGEAISVSANALGSFNNKNVGNAKAVDVSGVALGGSGAGNYSIASATTTTADITAKVLTISGVVAHGKVYDATTSATLSNPGRVDTGVAGETLVLTGATSATFDTKNVGSRNVTASGYGLADGAGGGLASNYVLSSNQVRTVADISPRELGLNVPGATKVYDGSTLITPTGGASPLGVLGSEVVALDLGRVTGFVSKNVGDNKPVTFTGFALLGDDAGNYVLPAQAVSNVSITPRPLGVDFTGQPKVYDGTTGATVTTQDNRVPGDVLTLLSSANFLHKNAAKDKPIAVTGVALAGADAGNYSVPATGTAKADVAPKPVSISGLLPKDKLYDGSAGVTVDTRQAVVNGLVPGDAVAVTASGQLADLVPGVGKPVDITVGLTGIDAGNYAVELHATGTIKLSPDLTQIATDTKMPTLPGGGFSGSGPQAGGSAGPGLPLAGTAGVPAGGGGLTALANDAAVGAGAASGLGNSLALRVGNDWTLAAAGGGGAGIKAPADCDDQRQKPQVIDVVVVQGGQAPQLIRTLQWLAQCDGGITLRGGQPIRPQTASLLDASPSSTSSSVRFALVDAVQARLPYLAQRGGQSLTVRPLTEGARLLASAEVEPWVGEALLSALGQGWNLTAFRQVVLDLR